MKSISISFISSVVILAVTAIAGVVSARALLPRGNGELTAVILWPTLLAYLGNLSVVDAVTYYTADGLDRATNVLASGMAVAFVLMGGLVGLGYLVIPAVLSGYGPGVVSTSRLYLVYIPINLMTLTLMAVISGKLRLTEYNVLRTLVHVITSAGMIVLWLTSRASVWTYALTSLIANLATMAGAMWVVAQNGWVGWGPDFQIARKLIRYGLKSHLGSVASQLNLRLDQMLLSIFLPPSILGLYAVAVSISALATLAANTISIVAFPRIANLASEQLKQQVFGRFMRLSLCLSLISVGALYLPIPWVIRLLFGVAYADAAGPARVLVFAGIPLGCNILFAAGLKAFNQPLASGKAQVVGLGVTAASLIALLPAYQALGAAWASLLAYSASFLYLAWQTRQKVGLSLPELLVPNVKDWNDLKNLVSRRGRHPEPT